MATYKEIKGVTVETRDSDPVSNVGTWASGGSLNTSRSDFGGAGIQTSALAFGGNNPTTLANNEEYNGSSWTEVGDLNSGRNSLGGFGANAEAAIAYGGRDPTTRAYTEQFDGTSWTEVNDMNAGRIAFCSPGVGTSTSGMAVGGSPTINRVEEWDGSSWSEVAELNTGVTQGATAGANAEAAIKAGGYTDSDQTANAEVWNGSAWTEVNNLNTAKFSNTMSGTSTDALNAGGRNPSGLAQTESWNGTSWTEVNDLSTARFDFAAGGYSASTASIVFGGKNPPSSYKTETEEWSFPPVTSTIIKEGDVFLLGGTTFKGVVKASSPSTTWSSGGTTNSPRAYGFSFGPQTAAQMAAGEAPARVSVSEQYNGTSWTEVNDTNHAGGAQARAGSGTQTAATIAGFAGASTPYGHAETWNGSSWSETAELNTTKYSRASTLTSGPAALVFGGTSPATANTETFDGTSWSEVNNLNAAKYTHSGVGSPTAGMSINGYEPGGYTTNVESWNGTSWTEGTNTNAAQGYGGAAGASSSNAMKFGGSGGGTGFSAITELWNGSSWTEIGNLSTDYSGNIGTGSSAAALNIPGKSNPSTIPGACEEFTGDITLQTITVS